MKENLENRPMFEKRLWGEYKVIHIEELSDGYQILAKRLTVEAGKNISYQIHHHRNEVWTFIDGEGILVLDGKVSHVRRGDTVAIKAETLHAVRALKDLKFIEVQSGDFLSEEDIERFDWDWEPYL